MTRYHVYINYLTNFLIIFQLQNDLYFYKFRTKNKWK